MSISFRVYEAGQALLVEFGQKRSVSDGQDIDDTDAGHDRSSSDGQYIAVPSGQYANPTTTLPPPME